MSGKRKKHSEEEEEHGPDERWMASYMDMVTVLMCMFIVLFAMSTVDADKFSALRNSLATGFGVTDIGKIDSAKGTIVQPDKADKNGESFAVGTLDGELANKKAAIKEVNDLKALEAKIAASLSAQGILAAVEFQIDQRGLTIRLIDHQTFFASNSTALTGVAPQVLDSVAPILAVSTYDVSVEGHADIRQTVAPFASNWELSSGRAVEVLRRMVEVGGVNAARIGAVGYGSSRPLADGTAPDDLAKNRRVDIVALSNAPESVRALIPGVLDGSITDTTAADANPVKAAAPTNAVSAVASRFSTATEQNAPSILLPASASGR